MVNQGKSGYTVVADLKELPFKKGVFDLVWSFSVIQHTCEKRLNACIEGVFNILKAGGYSYLEFPNSQGIRNKRGHAMKNALLTDDCNSWHVRYYSVEEYRRKFESVFGNFSFDVHSSIGIGVLPEDLKYVTGLNKLLCSISLMGTVIFKTIKPLSKKADSIYIKAQRLSTNNNDMRLLTDFKNTHFGRHYNNLNIVPLLSCPATGGDLILSEDKNFLLSPKAQLKYPVIEEIPVMIKSEALSF